VKRIAALVGAVIATLVLAAPAQAARISFDYCESSLRGGGSLAPDNDIKIFWDRYESTTGRDIVSSSRTAAKWNNEQWVAMQFVFLDGLGNPIVWKWFNCWRDGYVWNGQYHDDAAP
jgi:hypothetical protein